MEKAECIAGLKRGQSRIEPRPQYEKPMVNGFDASGRCACPTVCLFCLRRRRRVGRTSVTSEGFYNSPSGLSTSDVSRRIQFAKRG